MERNRLLCNKQHVFRSGEGTDRSTAVMELLYKLFVNIDNDCISDCLFLDYSKAFNTVNHNTLLKKLKFYGFDCKGLGWLTSYFEGQSQRAVVDGKVSDTVRLKSGVFQGAP